MGFGGNFVVDDFTFWAGAALLIGLPRSASENVATAKKSPTPMDALRSAWFDCGVDCKPEARALPTSIMKSKLITSSAIAALVAVPFLFGCRSVPGEDEGSETAPEGTTALAPEYRRLPASGPVSFAHQVKPILESKCLPCHSASEGGNGFRLDTGSHAFARGAAGARIIPGKPDESLLLALSSAHAGMDVMPRVGNRLTRVEMLILRQWIIEGARWPAGRAGQLSPSDNWLRTD